MPTTYTLTQTFNGTTAPETFTLAPGDRIDTGTMSACVSVIVLFGAAGAPTQAVAQHAGGGAANLNLDAIVAAVPVPQRATARVFVITGSDALQEEYESTGNVAIRGTKTALRTAGFRIIQVHHGGSGAIVDEGSACTRY